jgi:release factor glutamine methyltransferase
MRAVGRVVSEGATLLEGGFHPENARRDAETLMLHMLRRNRAWLIAHGNEELPDALCANYTAMVERRRRGEPIQYITGEQEFYGLLFGVTPEVLIPRPETELLVEKALEAAAEWVEPRILDVGTGSGAIAVALACQLPQAEVTALDVSSAALNVARTNARRNGIEGLIQFVESDLLDGVAGVSFEIIVSNPPYVPSLDYASLCVEVREYEPGLALFAGQDGLEVYRRLIPVAFAALAPGGSLLMEIGYEQAKPVSDLLMDSGYDGVNFIPDLQGISRVACGRRPGRCPPADSRIG